MRKIFSSRDYLGANKKNYFEGWYFRHSAECPFAFIVGISKCETDKHSFIQYIDCESSHYFRFDESALHYDKQDMRITVGVNVFSLKGINVNLNDEDWHIKTELSYSDMTEFKTSACTPSVMGPFSYLPMFCSHAVISLQHCVRGEIEVNGNSRTADGIGYIEKDFGSKFPENYFWTHIAGKNLSIMCAVAWPLIFGIKGFLCVILLDGVQYNFSLYRGAVLKTFELSSDKVDLQINQGKNSLILSAKSGAAAQKLFAPDKKGRMTVEIAENLRAIAKVRLIIDVYEIPIADIEQCAFESVLK